MATRRNSPKSGTARKKAPAKRNQSSNRGAKARTATSKKAASTKTTRITHAARARETAADNPGIPVLSLIEPGEDHFTRGWKGKMQWLMSLPGMSVEVMADRSDRHKASIYKWLDPTDYGNSINIDVLEKVADQMGFPPAAWHGELSEFIETIYSLYPGFIGLTHEEAGSSDNITSLMLRERHEIPSFTKDEQLAGSLSLAVAA